MSEQEHKQILGSTYSLAFIRVLIVHGVLRANIKYSLPEGSGIFFLRFARFILTPGINARVFSLGITQKVVYICRYFEICIFLKNFAKSMRFFARSEEHTSELH